MENRRYKRYALDTYDIHGEMLFVKDLKILDISIAGISLKSDKRMNIDREYTLKIIAKDQTLILKGKVMWSLLSENQEGARGDIIPIYTAGLKFTDVSNEKMKEIINFIEKHMQEKDRQKNIYELSGPRLFTRFQIEASAERPTLNFYEVCEVKKISLGGMLIESEHPIEIEIKMLMELTFPEDKVITLQCRVASSLLIANTVPERYDIGVEFLEISERDHEILVEFINLLDTDKDTMDIKDLTERRKHERIPFIQDILIDSVKRVRSTDISEKGLYVSSVQPLDVGTVIEVAIPVDGETLEAKARVTFHDSRVGFGLMFLDLDDTQKIMIEKLVQSAIKKCSQAG
jgi:c-di-GMP-binding flagellar brake protein YcgR